VSCSGDPAQVSLCHCLACQRRTGNTYGIAAFYPRENVRVAGDAETWGLLVDARGERLTPSHAVKKGRRYRYYVSAALITDAGADRAQGWRLAAREIEEAVIRILADALTSPAGLVERFSAAGMPSDQIRKLGDSQKRDAHLFATEPRHIVGANVSGWLTDP
jgi:hypothetical protein